MTGDSPCTVSKANPGFSSATDDIYGAFYTLAFLDVFFREP